MYTNIGLVEHCERALVEDWGYVYGTYGKVLTEKYLDQKYTQYPKQIGKHLDFIKANNIGKRTVDCVNLIKSYLWWDDLKNNPSYSIRYDKVDGVWMSADGSFTVGKEKDDISSLPELPGVCVYYKGHIGVYIGNGEVIEARGTKYGVVKTKLKDRPWTHWLKYSSIEYLDETNHKAIIQNRCQFSHPEAVWEVIDMHGYAQDLYKKWANSYKR